MICLIDDELYCIKFNYFKSCIICVAFVFFLTCHFVCFNVVMFHIRRH